MNKYFFNKNLKLYGKEIVINNKVKTIARFKELEESSKFYGYDFKYMFTKVGEIEQGDTIDALNHTWLIISEGENCNYIYDKCVVARANKIKIFIDDKLHEIPCLIESFNQNINDGKYINLPIGSIKLTIPLNQFTKNITYNNRFIKMNNAWEIVGFTSENKGLIYLYCQKTQFNSEDDKENEIADATKHIHTYNLNIINKSPILINLNDDPIVIEVECTDNDKKVEKPTLIYTTDREDIIKIEDNKIIPIKNGSCTLEIQYANIKKSIDVNVIEQETNKITVEITGQNKIKWGMKGTYTVTLKNNDKVYKDKITFELVEKDTGKATKLAKIIEKNDQSCTIQANDDQNSGEIILKIKTSTGETQQKEINICSFWIM